jgi:hypothetical protein
MYFGIYTHEETLPWASRNFERQGKSSEEGDGVVSYVKPTETQI